MRWQVNDLARRLDERPPAVDLCDEQVPAPASNESALTADGAPILAAIDCLPEDERDAFDTVRIQELSQSEAAQVLGVSVVIASRRKNRGLQLLAASLAELDPGHEGRGEF